MEKQATTFLDIMDSITPSMYNQASFYRSLKSLYDGEHAIISFKEMIPEVAEKIGWVEEGNSLAEDISTIIVDSSERWYHELQGLVCNGIGPDKRPGFVFYDFEWDTPIGSIYRVPVAVFDDHKCRNFNIGFPDFKAIPQEIRNEFYERFNESSEKFYGFSILVQLIHKLKCRQIERLTYQEFLVRFKRSVHRDEALPATSDKTETIPVEDHNGQLSEKDYNALHKEMKNDIAQQSIDNGCTNLGLPSSDPTNLPKDWNRASLVNVQVDMSELSDKCTGSISIDAYLIDPDNAPIFHKLESLDKAAACRDGKTYLFQTTVLFFDETESIPVFAQKIVNTGYPYWYIGLPAKNYLSKYKEKAQKEFGQNWLKHLEFSYLMQIATAISRKRINHMTPDYYVGQRNYSQWKTHVRTVPPIAAENTSSSTNIATCDDLVAFDTEDKRRTATLVRIPVLVVDTRHDLYQKFIGHLTTLASDSNVLNVNEQSICPEKILKFRIPLMLGGIIEKELDVFVVWFRGVPGVIKVSVPLDPVTGEKTSDWNKFLPDACAHSYLLQVISSLGNIARRRMIIDMLQSESYIRLSPEAILKKARVTRREQPKETPESNGMFFDTESNTAIVVQ